MTMPDVVGFIGLGNMGGPMALNLAKNGFALVVHDVDRAKVERLRSRGAKTADSAKDVAAASARTIVMVETTAQAESAIAEALILGVKAGLDPQTIYDVIRVSTGTSHAFETGVPKILKRDFSPGGTVDITFKDQELQTAFAKQLGVPLFLANVTQQLYQAARAAGLNK